MKDFNNDVINKNLITEAMAYNDSGNGSGSAEPGLHSKRDTAGQVSSPKRWRIKAFFKAFFVFITGAAGYGLIETLFRGYTHWTMVLTGGSCLLTLYYLNKSAKDVPIFIKALVGALVITLYELCVGLIVNVWFGWNVWDYSALPGNFLGQICLIFSIMWFALCFILATISWFWNLIFKTGFPKAAFRL